MLSLEGRCCCCSRANIDSFSNSRRCHKLLNLIQPHLLQQRNKQTEQQKKGRTLMAALTSSTIPKHIYHLLLSLQCRISLNGGTSASLLPLISSLALTKCLLRADLTDGYQSAAEIHQPNGLLTGVILTSIYIVFVSGGGGGEARRCDGPDTNTWNISFSWAETTLHRLSGRSLMLPFTDCSRSGSHRKVHFLVWNYARAIQGCNFFTWFQQIYWKKKVIWPQTSLGLLDHTSATNQRNCLLNFFLLLLI